MTFADDLIRNAIMRRVNELTSRNVSGYGMRRRRGGVLTAEQKQDIKERSHSSLRDLSYDIDERDPSIYNYKSYIKQEKERERYIDLIEKMYKKGMITLDNAEITRMYTPVFNATGELNKTYTDLLTDALYTEALQYTDYAPSEVHAFSYPRLKYVIYKGKLKDSLGNQKVKNRAEDEQFYKDINELYPLRKERIEAKKRDEYLRDMEAEYRTLGDGRRRRRKSTTRRRRVRF